MFIPIEFQKVFDETRQNAIAIQATYCENPELLSSHFGGVPYWQAGVKVPCDKEGNPLALLAQLNFAEIFATIPAHTDLPQKGILQFFIPRNDETYGAQLDGIEDGQLVTQFWNNPSLDKADDKLTWLEASENDLFPVFGAHVLSFAEKQDVPSIDTIECAEALNANPFEVLEDIALNEKEETLFFDAINAHVQSEGHKLLGYPYLMSSEPRESSDYRLLLQIDTDMNNDNDIMWGEEGVGQIFIRKEDLLAQHFENCYLYWSC